MLHDLIERLEKRSANVAVIGLGYVGLAVSCSLANAGFRVLGIERRADRVAKINAGILPIEGTEPGLAEMLASVVKAGKLVASGDPSGLASCDVVLLTVDTPVASDHRPRYEALRSACRALGANLKQGALVIVESTVAPGTTDRLVGPLLTKVSGKQVNRDFFLGHCPERVMPGRLLHNLRNVSRVCGGSTPETAQAMTVLYRAIVDAPLDTADCVTAELVKTAENAYRDVNIAFANELAMVCEASGADFPRVRELVNKSPGRALLVAGAGVGGHCIPKDSWLLAFGAPEMEPRIMAAARNVNDTMPLHVGRLVEDALDEAGRSIDACRVAVLGYAYLENSDDSRNSPSETLIGHLREWGAEIVVHDPWVEAYHGDVWSVVKGADAVVIMVAHDEYRALDLKQLAAVMRTPVLVDGRFVVSVQDARAAGLRFRAVGRGTTPKD